MNLIVTNPEYGEIITGSLPTGVQLTAPIGGAVVTTTPTLEWLPFEGATEYRVQVWDYTGNVKGDLLREVVVSGTSYTVSPALANDTLYLWRVDVADKNFPTPVEPVNEITGTSISPSTAQVNEGSTINLEGSVQGTGNYETVGVWTRQSGTATTFTITGNSIAITGATASSSDVYRFTADNGMFSERTVAVQSVDEFEIDDSLEGDLQALQDLYEVTDGANWTNNSGWSNLTTANMGNAYGVTVNGQGRVSELRLTENNLVNYELEENGDPVKTELLQSTATGGGWSRVDDSTLNMETDEYKGHLLVVLSGAGAGNQVRIQSNTSNSFQLTKGWGGNSTSVYAVYDTTYKLIAGRELKNSISNLQQMKILFIQKNRITGPIPAGFYSLTGLEHAMLAHNDTNPNLHTILWPSNPSKNDYIGNKFTGGISPLIGNMSSLKRLFLDRNYFTGTPIPTEIGQLNNLEYLVINKNGFTGILPPELGTLSSLISLQITGGNVDGGQSAGSFSDSSNSLEGSLPEELGQLSNLRSIRMSFHRFSGAFPALWANMSSMQEFVVSTTFVGTVPFPNHINNDNMPNMTTFFIRGIDMSGSEIDPDYNGGNINVFNLQANNVDGQLPLCFTDSNNENFNTKFTIFEVMHNNFDGPVADTMGGVFRPRRIIMHSNNFTGPLPSEFPVHISTSGDQLAAIQFQNNFLSGDIPVGMGAMTTVRTHTISLGNNNLSGYEAGAFSPVVLDDGNYVSGLRATIGLHVDGNDLPQAALDQIILDVWANVQSRLGTQWENWGSNGILRLQGQTPTASPSNTTEINDAISGLESNGWTVQRD